MLVKEPDTGKELEGWALNLSRGGLRCILEEKVELGAEYFVTLGDGEDVGARRARVVWVQEEPDGVIVGVEFVGLSGIHLPTAQTSQAPQTTDGHASPAGHAADGPRIGEKPAEKAVNSGSSEDPPG